MKKRFFTYIGALIVLGSTVFAVNGLSSTTSAATVDRSRDCDNVAIIRCGAYTKNELLNDYDNHGRNTQKIYRAFGISRNDIGQANFKNGVVWRDGRVTVDGKTVATDAMTAGRNFGGTPIEGTNAGKYSTSKFVTDGQIALVSMKDGRFQFAVVKTCGNPVSANPKEQPKPQPEPKYECVELTADKLSRTKYRFTAEATASGGATIEQYEFGFGDGFGITVDDNTYTYQYDEPGTHETDVRVHVLVNGETDEVTSQDCRVTVTIPEKPEEPEPVEVCNPDTGEIITVPADEADNYAPVGSEECEEIPPVEVCNPDTGETITVPAEEADQYAPIGSEECEDQPEAIPDTGPTEIIGGTIGLGLLSAAGYHYGLSRRELVNTLLGR